MAFSFSKKSGSKVGIRDASKSRRLHIAFARLSKKKNKELTKAAAQPQSRTGVKVSMEFNRSGNMRGMNVRNNPPDSEHMKKIRAMRRFYNKQMPVLQCSGCAFASSCPQFKAGFECAFLPYLNSHQITDEQDLIESMKTLAEANIRRAHLQTLMETLTGGMPSLEVSESLKLAFDQVRDLHERITDASRTSISVESDDTSIIAKLFGSMDSLVGTTKAAQDTPLLVPLNVPIEAQSVSNVDQEVSLELMREHSKDELNSMVSAQEAQTNSNGLNKKAKPRTSGPSPTISISNLK